MKILDNSTLKMRATQRVSRINDEIRRLCGTTLLDQIHAELLVKMELDERIEWVDVLQMLEKESDEQAAIYEAAQEKARSRTPSFPKFQFLPKELRMKIVTNLSHCP